MNVNDLAFNADNEAFICSDEQDSYYRLKKKQVSPRKYNYDLYKMGVKQPVQADLLPDLLQDSISRLEINRQY